LQWTSPEPLILSPEDLKAEDGDAEKKEVNYKLDTTTDCKYNFQD